VSAPIYLDNHSTTPCDPRVVEAMLPYFTERFGNAGSRSHSYGLDARAAVEHARTQVAALIGASPKEIVFTSGATEADNIAILGTAMEHGGGHLVVSAIEHKAVLDSAKYAQKHGFDLTVVPVGSDGVVDPADVAAALRDDTVLVSVMLANNEIGTVQPVAEIGALTRPRGIALHVDAVQGCGRVPIDVEAMNVDLMAVTAHKMYGPKGIGALYVRRGRPRVRLAPLFHGGGQERGIRPGTLPVPLIVALGRTAELAHRDLLDGHIDGVRALRDRLWDGLQRIGDVSLNGSLAHRLPNNLNVCFHGVEAQALMMNLRTEVALSSGSACSSESLTPSFVLKAIGLSDTAAYGSLRFGIGRWNTADEIDRVIELVGSGIAGLRALDASA
jgi:cysteine desulfurase